MPEIAWEINHPYTPGPNEACLMSINGHKCGMGDEHECHRWPFDPPVPVFTVDFNERDLSGNVLGQMPVWPRQVILHDSVEKLTAEATMVYVSGVGEIGFDVDWASIAEVMKEDE